MKLEKELEKEIDIRGISKDQLDKQLNTYKQGAPKLIIDRIASINDGIIAIDDVEKSRLINIYNIQKQNLVIYKFTPASGMASRMFKGLSELLNSKRKNEMSRYFFNNLRNFPFYKEMMVKFNKRHPEIKHLGNLTNKLIFLDFILNKEGLDYINTPKALIKFHQYDFDNKSALEEQIEESLHYCISKDQTINMHFTIKPLFINEFQKVVEDYIQANNEYSTVKFNINFSTQNPNTDTIAVNKNLKPFKNKNGKFIFRAGGHGALIDNLNNLDADIIFIKNIDNVCHRNHIEETIKHKQVLGGKLLCLQEKTHKHLNLINTKPDEINLIEVVDFVKKNFSIEVSNENLNKEFLFNLLNKPIRVCGMIKNQGDAGGGPFWVKKNKKENCLQIVESTQIDTADKDQLAILHQSTHFNPVDIVCSFKDYRGNKFDLKEFVDNDAVFISNKSLEGMPIKALELPGLWNGGMSKWLTVFVEVPIQTFNPVKSVTDLLSPMHQA